MKNLSQRARSMVRMSVLALVVATASMTVSACVPLKSGAPNPADPSLVQLFQLVNNARAAQGLAPLPQCPVLFKAADAHNRDMSARGYFDHISPEGFTPADRAVAVGYGTTFVGENIAVGQQTAQEVFDGWMGSPGHRANILSPDYTHAGFAYFGGYWTQVFGAGGNCGA